MDKIKYGFKMLGDSLEIEMENFPSGISITALEFGKALAKRKMEGYSPDPEEEIDVISGIKNERTTGETIKFIYKKGDYTSGLILLGVLAEKLLKEKIIVQPYEIGGIYYGDKNEAYIRVAIQKMVMTKDALGSSLEIFLPESVNMNSFKPVFSEMAFKYIPEIEAIQFGLGISVTKKANSNIPLSPKRVEVSLAPSRDNKIPALACVYDIVLKSIAMLTIINLI